MVSSQENQQGEGLPQWLRVTSKRESGTGQWESIFLFIRDNESG